MCLQHSFSTRFCIICKLQLAMELHTNYLMKDEILPDSNEKSSTILDIS